MSLFNDKGYPRFCVVCGKEIVYMEDKDNFMVKCGCSVRHFRMNVPTIEKIKQGVWKYE